MAIRARTHEESPPNGNGESDFKKRDREHLAEWFKILGARDDLNTYVISTSEGQPAPIPKEEENNVEGTLAFLEQVLGPVGGDKTEPK